MSAHRDLLRVVTSESSFVTYAHHAQLSCTGQTNRVKFFREGETVKDDECAPIAFTSVTKLSCPFVIIELLPHTVVNCFSSCVSNACKCWRQNLRLVYDMVLPSRNVEIVNSVEMKRNLDSKVVMETLWSWICERRLCDHEDSTRKEKYCNCYPVMAVVWHVW